MTDDGSYGQKGVVTAALEELIAAGNQYDEVITIGPLIMMKFVVKTCQKKYHIKSVVSMNPIMIDGTGHVRRLPPDRGRQAEVCLRGRPRL